MVEHFISDTCGGEVCSLCGAPATHKVGEEIARDDPAWVTVLGHTMLTRHNYTAYVCCAHFRAIFGSAVPCAMPTEARRWCSGDQEWSNWAACTAEQAERYSRDDSIQVRTLSSHANLNGLAPAQGGEMETTVEGPGPDDVAIRLAKLEAENKRLQELLDLDEQYLGDCSPA